MSPEIKEAVNSFKAANGNKDFTNKDLLMYLITRVDALELEIDTKLAQLPCVQHYNDVLINKDDITRLKTTNKILALVIGTALTIFGLVIGIINICT